MGLISTSLNPQMPQTRFVPYSLQAGQRKTKTNNRPTAADEQDFKFAKMVDKSDTTLSRNWEDLCDQWMLLEYDYYPSGKEDYFGNHLHHVYTFINHFNQNEIEMGPDDAKKLFPDLIDTIEILKRTKKSINFIEVINAAQIFHKKAVSVGEYFEKTGERALQESFLSLVYLLDHLPHDEKEELHRTINSLDVSEINTEVINKQWVISRAKETCLKSYKDLVKRFPHLKSLVDEKYEQELVKFKTCRALYMMPHKRINASFHRELDRKVENKKEELHSNGFSFLEIFQLESEYRTLNGKPSILEQMAA